MKTNISVAELVSAYKAQFDLEIDEKITNRINKENETRRQVNIANEHLANLVSDLYDIYEIADATPGFRWPGRSQNIVIHNYIREDRATQRDRVRDLGIAQTYYSIGRDRHNVQLVVAVDLSENDKPLYTCKVWGIDRKDSISCQIESDTCRSTDGVLLSLVENPADIIVAHAKWVGKVMAESRL